MIRSLLHPQETGLFSPHSARTYGRRISQNETKFYHVRWEQPLEGAPRFLKLRNQNKRKYFDGYFILILSRPETHNWLPSGTFN
jgi:hypothetical protein